MNSGSLLSLNVSARCGLRRNAFQIRPTVDFDSPDRFAIDARDQWVASFGACSKVATTTRQRNANACALLRRWDQRTNVSRSTSDSASSALGRPRPAIRQSLHQQSHHRDTTLPQLDNESTAPDTSTPERVTHEPFLPRRWTLNAQPAAWLPVLDRLRLHAC